MCFSPLSGFLLGLIPAAAVIGGLSRRSSSPVRLALACGAGLAVLYAVGVPYMALIVNGYLGKGISAPALLWSGMLVYLPGDAAKIAVTALLCPVLRRRIPGAAVGERPPDRAGSNLPYHAGRRIARKSFANSAISADCAGKRRRGFFILINIPS